MLQPFAQPLDQPVPHPADVLTQHHGTNLDDDDEWVVGDLSRLAQRSRRAGAAPLAPQGYAVEYAPARWPRRIHLGAAGYSATGLARATLGAAMRG
jgi:hypothetical protein